MNFMKLYLYLYRNICKACYYLNKSHGAYLSSCGAYFKIEKIQTLNKDHKAWKTKKRLALKNTYHAAGTQPRTLVTIHSSQVTGKGNLILPYLLL